MSSYVKPQVLVFQEFAVVPTEITEPLRAHVSGPHAVLHRYNDAEEKSAGKLGEYDYLNDTCYAYPGRLPGSLVDHSYTKLYIDNALLKYYEHTVGQVGTTVSAVEGRSNWIAASAVAFKNNGTAYPRSAAFGDRDVQLGDVAYLRAVSADNDCEEVTLWTTVTGFASETVPSDVDVAAADDDNQDSVNSAAATITKTAGPNNCISASVDGSDYDGLLDGAVEEEYTIEVIKSSVPGCAAARLRVRSASGNDDVAEVTPADFGDPTDIGTRGLKVTFHYDPGSACSLAAGTAEVAPDALVVGQKWKVEVSQEFDAAAATSGGTYDGDKNDVYIVECTKGGVWADLPEITVRTVKGLDFSGPTEVTAANTAVAIGSNGVTIKFNAVVSVQPFTMAPSADYPVLASSLDSLAGLRKGDKWYVPVLSSKAGAVRKLILRDDLPAGISSADDIDLRLFIKDDIQVSKNRVGYAPLTNYELEATQVCVHEGIVAYHPEWTRNGVEQALEVRGGSLYIEYREWLAELADEVNSLQSVSDLGQIKGQLHPDNPLKWGVYKALSNSNGTVVKYTAVANPDDLDSWVAVLDRVKGRDDMYNLVPLTFDRAVQNLYAAHINGESNETANNWKGGVFALKAPASKKVAGQGALIAGVSGNVVEEVVLATLADDPNATNTQYTLLQVSGGNGYFITNGVQPGDIVRYLYTVDGFGEEQYQEFVVDSVVAESSLLLYAGAEAPVSVAQRVEIYRNLNRNEVADAVATQAGSFSSRRVVATWPDQVGEAGTMQPGYYLSAAIAGLVSGVVPHQPLTNVEVAGFDDFSRAYKFFNETQLNRLAEAGVWVVTENRDGTPFTRHALTTDNLDLNRREEMIRRNVDSMSYLFLRRLRPYIGRVNVTDGMVRYLRAEVVKLIDYFKTSGTTTELGGQLIDGEISVLRIHPLLRDRIEIVLNLTVPAPLNNIELHLVV